MAEADATSPNPIVVPPVPADPDLVLSAGAVEVLGRMPWSSNATLLVRVRHDAGEALAIYKPRAGERPLRDFPPGLDRREVAARELDSHLGWDLVPPTVLREGPHGEGSLQLFLDADHSQHYFTVRDHPDHDAWLRRLATFDLLTNQTDRKSGHVLMSIDGRLWAIDNGLSFHATDKIRTVLWDFAGQPLPAEVCPGLQRATVGDLPSSLFDLLDETEVFRLRDRAAVLLDEPEFPEPPWGDYSYPWPIV